MKTLFYSLGSLILIGVILVEGQFVLKPFLLAVMISTLINPFVDKVAKLLRFRPLAYILTFSVIITLFSILFYFIGGQLFSLFEDLQSEQYNREQIESTIKDLLAKFGISHQESSRWISQGIDKFFSEFTSILTGILTTGTSGVITLILTVVFSYFLSVYNEMITKKLTNLWSRPNQKKIKNIISEFPIVVRHYMNGMFIVMFILGLFTSLAYWAIGLDYAFVWGGITGILAIIPYLGSTIAAILPITYSLISSQSISEAVFVAIIFGVMQQIEGNFLTPKVVGDKVNINPLSIIIIMMICAQLWGILGVFLSIPLAGVLKIALEQWEDTKDIAVLLSTDIMKSK